MKIALVQQTAGWNREQNRQKGMEAVKTAAGRGAKIIAFSELAFEPFYPQFEDAQKYREFAEPLNGDTVKAFQQLAKQYKVVIILNIFELSGNKTYDSSPVIDADGTVLGVTRMVHITEYECFFEQRYYSPGDMGAPVYKTAYGNVGVAICYDRHYPEYMRMLALNGADLVIIPQAGSVGEWPAGLYEAEMRVAAFQNGYFTALCNRVGHEEKLTFAGESFVCDPQGVVIAQAGSGTEEILYADIDFGTLENSSARKLFLRDRRPALYSKWFDIS